jgi:ABC-type nitrate/sulfonate/bicarbonate transport system ATPase subunit/ABC-type transporter Mla maintaining outer membrane lipid asymmetry permease subunit MlaE
VPSEPPASAADLAPVSLPPPSSVASIVVELSPLSVSDTSPDVSPAVLSIRGLDVALPDGTLLVEAADLTLAAGQIISLLGPSGAGKSTLLRALVSPDELRGHGYAVAFSERHLESPVAFIPQRGALFDHLDVAGNIALAGAAAGQATDTAAWLAAVDLDATLGHPGTSVATLSGGQAQRVAVARTLAAGRTIIILDEPSVGLDPLGVRRLARLLVEQARERALAILIITHDLALAAGVSDVVLFLDPARRRLVDVLPDWAGPAELAPADERRDDLSRLDAAVHALLDGAPAPAARARGARAALPGGPGALRIVGASLLHAFNPRLAGPSLGVFLRALRQAFFRPLPFYVVVGALLGFTVLYVIARMSVDLRVLSVLRLVGGTYILSLAPPLSAILFAATSGNAVNAWLGGMALNRQLLALDGIGVSSPRYLWSPAWLSLVIAYLGTVVVFVASMILGGWILFQLHGGQHALAILTSDFVDPAPGRGPYLVRGIWLTVAYAVAIATIVVGSGVAPKDEAAHVTSAMTSAVVRATLFVVAMELASIIVLFAVVGR